MNKKEKISIPECIISENICKLYYKDNIKIVQKLPKCSGHMIYGPYISLPKGIYCATFHFYNTKNIHDHIIGTIEVVSGPNGNTKHADMLVYLSDIKYNKNKNIIFHLNHDTNNIEFRLHTYSGEPIEISPNIDLISTDEKIIFEEFDSSDLSNFIINNFDILLDIKRKSGCTFSIYNKKLIVNTFYNSEMKNFSRKQFKLYVENNNDIQVLYELLCVQEYNCIYPRDCIALDIGMNAGYTSLFLASMDNIKKVYSFEPFGPTYARAMENFKINEHLNYKITSYNIGLDDHTYDTTCKYIENESIGLTIQDVVNPEEGLLIHIKDAVLELKKIINRNKENLPIIVKIDCEGAEIPILHSFYKENLLKYISVILMEYHKFWHSPFHEADIMKWLAENNFVIQNLINKNMMTGMIYATKTC